MTLSRATRLDLIIVYSQSLAKSASSPSHTPFPQGSKNQFYNTVYGYFLRSCQKAKLKAGFATSADIIGPGLCKSYWKFEKEEWVKVNSSCFANIIFDKFSPVSPRLKLARQLLFSSPQIKPFNDPRLYNLFFDKHLTYKKLSKFAIPTISLDRHTLEGITKSCQSLVKLTNSHRDSLDFGSDIIMKDRFGAGGRRVYKFGQGQPKNMLAVAKRHPGISYIIQPYINSASPTDTRLIYLNGKIVQTYTRVAKEGEFRCNEHQGGLVTYNSVGEISPSLTQFSNSIAKILRNNNSLFTLDFLTSNNGNTYLLEGNTGPGLDWNVGIKKNEFEAKKLIRIVVGELAARSISVY